MRAALLLLIVAGSVQAQGLPQGKPVTGIEFDSSKLVLGMPVVHIHAVMHGSCEGQPDHVYGESKGVYFACISGKDICTEAKAHKGAAVPRALITQYQQVKAIQEAERAEYEQAQKERQEQRVREGRSTGDPALDAALARQRSEAIANEVKTARAQGRRPDLAQFSKTGTPNAPARPAPAATVTAAKVTTSKRATAVPLADEKLNGIAAGAALGDVIRQLGNPYTRIAGESERLTYRLESGGTARLEFEGGILARIEIQPAAR